MDKQTALEKLQHLASLKNKQAELSQFVNKECNRYIQEKIDLVGKKVFAKQPDAPGVRHTYVDWTEFKPTISDNHIGLYIGGLAALAFVGLIFLPIAFGWGAYFTVMAIGVGVVFLLIRSDKAKEQKAKEQNEVQKQRLIEPFRRDMENYEAEVNHGLQQLPEYKQFYQHAVETLLQYINEIEVKKYAAQKELEECNIELAKIDFIPCEYFGLAENILHLLESGRADTYKEALNMAINQEEQRKHREKMEKIERERVSEVARHNAAMEAQAQEAAERAEQMQAEHNRAMERAAENQANAIRQAADDAARARKEADRAARQADSDAKARAWEQCRVCAKFSGCRNPGVPGCGAFVPRH